MFKNYANLFTIFFYSIYRILRIWFEQKAVAQMKIKVRINYYAFPFKYIFQQLSIW